MKKSLMSMWIAAHRATAEEYKKGDHKAETDKCKLCIIVRANVHFPKHLGHNECATCSQAGFNNPGWFSCVGRKNNAHYCGRPSNRANKVAKFHNQVADYLETLKPNVIRYKKFPKYVLNQIVKIDQNL